MPFKRMLKITLLFLFPSFSVQAMNCDGDNLIKNSLVTSNSNENMRESFLSDSVFNEYPLFNLWDDEEKIQELAALSSSDFEEKNLVDSTESSQIMVFNSKQIYNCGQIRDIFQPQLQEDIKENIFMAIKYLFKYVPTPLHEAAITNRRWECQYNKIKAADSSEKQLLIFNEILKSHSTYLQKLSTLEKVNIIHSLYPSLERVKKFPSEFLQNFDLFQNLNLLNELKDSDSLLDNIEKLAIDKKNSKVKLERKIADEMSYKNARPENFSSLRSLILFLKELNYKKSENEENYACPHCAKNV